MPETEPQQQSLFDAQEREGRHEQELPEGNLAAVRLEYRSALFTNGIVCIVQGLLVNALGRAQCGNFC